MNGNLSIPYMTYRDRKGACGMCQKWHIEENLKCGIYQVWHEEALKPISVVNHLCSITSRDTKTKQVETSASVL